MGVFDNVIPVLREMGFFSILLPFLLIFAIIYGILEKTKLFGEARHDINATIAFVIAMILVATAWAVGIVTDFLPWVGILSVIIVSFMILVGIMWGDVTKLQEKEVFKWGALIFVLVALAVIVMYLFGWGLNDTSQIFGIESSDIATVVALLAFVGVVVWIAKPPKSG